MFFIKCWFWWIWWIWTNSALSTLVVARQVMTWSTLYRCNMEPASVITLLYVIAYLCHIRGSWVIEMVGVCEQVRCFIQRLCSVKPWLKPNSLESMNFERFWTRAKRWLTPKLYLIIYQTLSLNVVPINQWNYPTWDLSVSNHVEYVS